jgi:hypothetical protein
MPFPVVLRRVAESAAVAMVSFLFFNRLGRHGGRPDDDQSNSELTD